MALFRTSGSVTSTLTSEVIAGGGGTRTLTLKDGWLFLAASTAPSVTVDGVNLPADSSTTITGTTYSTFHLQNLTSAVVAWDRGNGILNYI